MSLCFSATRATARSDDGIVEALELDHTAGWLLAVQWHPEDTSENDPIQQRLFDELVHQAERVG